jgi:hypothetical protein
VLRGEDQARFAARDVGVRLDDDALDDPERVAVVLVLLCALADRRGAGAKVLIQVAPVVLRHDDVARHALLRAPRGPAEVAQPLHGEARLELRAHLTGKDDARHYAQRTAPAWPLVYAEQRTVMYRESDTSTEPTWPAVAAGIAISPVQART